MRRMLAPSRPKPTSLVVAAAAAVALVSGAAMGQEPAPSGTAHASQPTPPAPAPARVEPAPPGSSSASVSAAAPAPGSFSALPAAPHPPGSEKNVEQAIFLSGDIGFTRSHLGVVEHDLGFDKTAANGVLYGLSAGLRFNRMYYGIRWRLHDTTEFSLWTISAQVGYAIPWGPLTPILSAHLGYVFDQVIQAGLFRSSLPEGNVLPPNVDLRGAILGVDLNGAYTVSKVVRVGPFVGADLMYLHRPPAPKPQSLFGPTPEVDSLPLYAGSGNSLGVNVNIGLRGTFDIAFE